MNKQLKPLRKRKTERVMQAVNHEILVWARETANLTREEAVKKLRISDTRKFCAVDRLGALENGTTKPTRAMLVKMAKHYHRSLLTFYLTDPPKLRDRGVDFRTLPNLVEEPENKILDALLREVRVRQSMVRAAFEDEDEVESLHFVGARNISEGESVLLRTLQEVLNVNSQQYQSQSDPRAAFSILRNSAENSGVFVLLKSDLGSYHTTINVKVFRGFVIADDIAPFIVINEQDAVPAWSFTLLHELVHLTLGHTGISGLHGDSEQEKFCNDVASEFLLPTEDLKLLELYEGMEIESAEITINEFARARHLSRSMVAYKALRKGLINLKTYEKLTARFHEQWIRSRKNRQSRAGKQEGGPSYYVVRQHRIGHGLIHFVYRMMTAGNLTTIKAAKILGVKPQNVQALFDFSIFK